jgi:hypothetical protein
MMTANDLAVYFAEQVRVGRGDANVTIVSDGVDQIDHLSVYDNGETVGVVGYRSEDFVGEEAAYVLELEAIENTKRADYEEPKGSDQ